LPIRNFVATETTDYAGSNRLLRVVGEVGAALGTTASLVEVPQGADPQRLLLDLQLQGGGQAADPQWIKVNVFERPMDMRREVLRIDIRSASGLVISLDVVEVVP